MGYYLTEQSTDQAAGNKSFSRRFQVGAKAFIGAPFGNPILSTKYWDEDSKLAYYGFRYYAPSLSRWLSLDRWGEYGGLNLYAFVENDPLNTVDRIGLKGVKGIIREIGKWLSGPGKLCTADSCNKKKCPAKVLDEDDWKKGWLDIPEPGGCMNVDAVATAKGILKIPNGVTCTIRCDDEGNAKDIECKKRVRFAPDPEPYPPDFPPNPFNPPPDAPPEEGAGS